MKRPLLFVLVVVLVCLLNWFLPQILPVPITSERWGQFGGMFGVAGALFSGLAFAVLTVTLREQRKANETTERNFQRQQHQIEEQNKTLQRQRFEATFFEMLRWHSYKLSTMTITFRGDDPEVISGKVEIGSSIRGPECFVDIINKITLGIPDGWPIQHAEMYVQQAQNNYKRVLQRHSEIVVLHLRLLFSLIGYVDKENIENKRFYINLLRSELLIDEWTMMLFFCGLCSMEGGPEFKSLIETYGILYGFQPTTALAIEMMKKMNDSAFKEFGSLLNPYVKTQNTY